MDFGILEPPVAVLNVVKPTLAVTVDITLLGSIELLDVADAVTAAVERAVVDAVVLVALVVAVKVVATDDMVAAVVLDAVVLRVDNALGPA